MLAETRPCRTPPGRSSSELMSDNGPNDFFMLEAGLFKFIRFNHRAMRAFWLASFIASEGRERVLYAVAKDEAPDFGRFNTMLDAFLRSGRTSSRQRGPIPSARFT
jgi:hypothetical protein